MCIILGTSAGKVDPFSKLRVEERRRRRLKRLILYRTCDMNVFQKCKFRKYF